MGDADGLWCCNAVLAVLVSEDPTAVELAIDGTLFERLRSL